MSNSLFHKIHPFSFHSYDLFCMMTNYQVREHVYKYVEIQMDFFWENLIGIFKEIFRGDVLSLDRRFFDKSIIKIIVNVY